jgi:hypothetical protein
VNGTCSFVAVDAFDADMGCIHVWKNGHIGMDEKERN